MHANEVPDQGVIIVDGEGTVWVPCGGADGRERFWRYVEDPADGALSWKQFRELPTDYEPYIALDGAAGSLVYRNLQAPKEPQPWAKTKR